MRSVGWGETMTYGELAQRAGSPGAARAVGQALSQNPIAVIIPCHRVLASDGGLGGFSAHGGVRAKGHLLALERVHRGDASRSRRRVKAISELSRACVNSGRDPGQALPLLTLLLHRVERFAARAAPHIFS